MKMPLIIGAALLAAGAFQAGAQPQPPQIVSKADRSTVEFVVRDGQPLLMDIYQFKDQETEGKRPVFIYSFGGAWAMGSRVDALCNPLYDHLCEKGWVCVAIDYRLGSARGTRIRFLDIRKAYFYLLGKHLANIVLLFVCILLSTKGSWLRSRRSHWNKQ